MASPPFVLNITIPGDTDIVSQFPAVDRTHLDIVNSWIKTDHNVNGTHNYSTYLQVGVVDGGGNTASAPTPAANNTAIYRDTDKALKAKNGDDASVEFLGGVPPGATFGYAGATLPTGYLWCDGTAVSRTTYARLFTAIGTTFGAGDGATTFNLPDMNGRMLVYRDRTGAGRITTAGSAVDGATLGATGGAQNVTLVANNIPLHTHTFSWSGTTSGASADHTHTFSGTTSIESATHVHTGTTDNGGVDHTHPYNDSTLGAGAPVPAGGASIGAVDTGRTTGGASAYLHTHTFTTGGQSANHTHTYSGTTSGASVGHTHTYSGSSTTDNNVSTVTAVNKMPPVIVLNAIIRI